MKIGALAETSGVHVETIRYYQAIGLIPKPARAHGSVRPPGPGLSAGDAATRCARGEHAANSSGAGLASGLMRRSILPNYVYVFRGCGAEVKEIWNVRAP